MHWDHSPNVKRLHVHAVGTVTNAYEGFQFMYMYTDNVDLHSLRFLSVHFASGSMAIIIIIMSERHADYN